MTTNNTNTTNISAFIENMKNADSRYAQIVKAVQVIYYVIIPVYLIMMVVQIFSNASVYVIAGSGCFLISLTIFALLLRNYYKEYNSVDYALPTLLMLKKAAKRYQPFPLKSLWALLAIIIMAAGLALNNMEFDTLRVILSFVGIMILSVIGGLIWWYSKYKPLRDGARKLIREIENG